MNQASEAGLPRSDYYGGDAKALEGAEALGKLKSVAEMGKRKGQSPLPENVTVDVGRVIPVRSARSQEVREMVP